MALRQAEIGERLGQLRRQRGNPPQEVVAQAIGVSYRSLQSWEAGDAKPSWRNLTKLAEYYGVSEEFILTGEIDPTAPRNATQLDRVERKLDALIQFFAGLEDAEDREAAVAALRNLAAVVTAAALDAGTPDVPPGEPRPQRRAG